MSTERTNSGGAVDDGATPRPCGCVPVFLRSRAGPPQGVGVKFCAKHGATDALLAAAQVVMACSPFPAKDADAYYALRAAIALAEGGAE